MLDLSFFHCDYHFNVRVVFKHHVHRRTYIRIFLRMHVSLGLINTTSTKVQDAHPLRPSKKHVPATTELFRGFGILIPLTPYPARTRGVQLNLDTSRFKNSGRQVYLLVIVYQEWADKRVRYAFG